MKKFLSVCLLLFVVTGCQPIALTGLPLLDLNSDESIAALSSDERGIRLRKRASTGEHYVTLGRQEIDLPPFENLRVTQFFQEQAVDYSIIQGQNSAGAPLCVLVIATDDHLITYELDNCANADLQVRYTDKHIELYQQGSAAYWQVTDKNTVTRVTPRVK